MDMGCWNLWKNNPQQGSSALTFVKFTAGMMFIIQSHMTYHSTLDQCQTTLSGLPLKLSSDNTFTTFRPIPLLLKNFKASQRNPEIGARSAFVRSSPIVMLELIRDAIRAARQHGVTENNRHYPGQSKAPKCTNPVLHQTSSLIFMSFQTNRSTCLMSDVHFKIHPLT